MAEHPTEIFHGIFKCVSKNPIEACACHRVHFNATSPVAGDVLQKSVKDPDFYVKHWEPLTLYTLSEQTMVAGCECEVAYEIEQFILKNATKIADYLNTWSRKLVLDAAAVRVHSPLVPE